jgi:hypothetical protein
MADTLQITKDAALTAYKDADTAGKALLEALLGKNNFLIKITDRIKSFEDACRELGEDPANFNVGMPDEIAYKKLKVITRALNEGWEPNWNNDNQYKWYPWFYMDSPGFRFYDSYYSRTAASAGAGSRLCFKSQELSTYAGQCFLELYRQFMTL